MLEALAGSTVAFRARVLPEATVRLSAAFLVVTVMPSTRPVTLMVTVALALPIRAVMVALPDFRQVTVPSSATEATLALEDFQVTSASASSAFPSATVRVKAFRVTVSFTFRARVVLVT